MDAITPFPVLERQPNAEYSRAYRRRKREHAAPTVKIDTATIAGLAGGTATPADCELASRLVLRLVCMLPAGGEVVFDQSTE